MTRRRRARGSSDLREHGDQDAEGSSLAHHRRRPLAVGQGCDDLVRAGEHSTGLVADELIGSREIVVKSVGPQISAIRGISGATILGDGRIVVILDINALVRAEWRGRSEVVVPRDRADKRTLALVIDDSITVRRVMPSRKQSGVGVWRTPSLIRNTLAPVHSATRPRQSSISASA